MIIRVRRDNLTPSVNDALAVASVGTHINLTLYGISKNVIITELTDEWVEFCTDYNTKDVMNEQQRRVLSFEAQKLEMSAHDLGNEAALLEREAATKRAEQRRLLDDANALRGTTRTETP